MAWEAYIGSLEGHMGHADGLCAGGIFTQDGAKCAWKGGYECTPEEITFLVKVSKEDKTALGEAQTQGVKLNKTKFKFVKRNEEGSISIRQGTMTGFIYPTKSLVVIGITDNDELKAKIGVSVEKVAVYLIGQGM